MLYDMRYYDMRRGGAIATDSITERQARIGAPYAAVWTRSRCVCVQFMCTIRQDAVADKA